MKSSGDQQSRESQGEGLTFVGAECSASAVQLGWFAETGQGRLLAAGGESSGGQRNAVTRNLLFLSRTKQQARLHFPTLRWYLDVGERGNWC